MPWQPRRPGPELGRGNPLNLGVMLGSGQLWNRHELECPIVMSAMMDDAVLSVCHPVSLRFDLMHTETTYYARRQWADSLVYKGWVSL
jgi:hypothetical protein